VNEVDLGPDEKPAEYLHGLFAVYGLYRIAYPVPVVVGPEQLPTSCESFGVRRRDGISAAFLPMDEHRACLGIGTEPRKRAIRDESDLLARFALPQATTQRGPAGFGDLRHERVSEVVGS